MCVLLVAFGGSVVAPKGETSNDFAVPGKDAQAATDLLTERSRSREVEDGREEPEDDDPRTGARAGERPRRSRAPEVRAAPGRSRRGGGSV